MVPEWSSGLQTHPRDSQLRSLIPPLSLSYPCRNTPPFSEPLPKASYTRCSQEFGRKGQEFAIASTSPFLEGQETQTALSSSPGTCSLRPIYRSHQSRCLLCTGGCCVHPGSAVVLGSLVQLPRKPSSPAKFSLPPKSHKVAAPLGYSI